MNLPAFFMDDLKKFWGNPKDDKHKEWSAQHINRMATDVKTMFHGFMYIIEVDHRKVHDTNGIGQWSVQNEFKTKYCYPSKELGDHTSIVIVRGNDTTDGRIFEITDFGERDATFAATNNKSDAIMLALTYK